MQECPCPLWLSGVAGLPENGTGIGSAVRNFKESLACQGKRDITPKKKPVKEETEGNAARSDRRD
jgi:Sec-independent protein translocase protein TatA